MAQPRRILWLAPFAALLFLLPPRAAAQSGTVTDDAFLSGNPVTQALNANGQGIALAVAGSSATVGPVHVGLTKSYITFQSAIDSLLKAPSPGVVAAAPPVRDLKDHPATEKGERRIRSARLELKEQTSGRQFPVHQFLRPQQSNMKRAAL
jgi:hypothetical protein